jgi:PadR family transcriptional regulator, regulatory protein PadR
MEPEKFLPLTQTTYYILASLFYGAKHGYAISKEVEALSNGTVRLAVGNLYVTLKRLLEQGVIARASDKDVEGEARKTYRLTGVGEQVLRLETARLEQMLRAGRPVIAAGGVVS